LGDSLSQIDGQRVVKGRDIVTGGRCSTVAGVIAGAKKDRAVG